MILHGRNLIVSIDGNSMLASKSCTMNVSAKTQKKTSPTSGEWEENLAGKKSWSLTTDHFLKSSSIDPVVITGSEGDFYFSNSRENGWTARGMWNEDYSQCFDIIGNDEGIHLLEISKDYAVIHKHAIFDKDAKYNNLSLSTYLSGEGRIEGSYIDDSCMIAIMTVGEFVLNIDTCNILRSKYHISLPCLQFGNTPVRGAKTYDTTPVIIAGHKDFNYGYTQLNSVSNELNFSLYGGNQAPKIDGIPGAIDMVGKTASLHMTDSNGCTWTGQAVVTQFKVTGTKGNLMAGSFSFKGNGELQTSKSVYDVAPVMPAKTVDRVIIDMTKSNPEEMITGNIDGPVINDILSNFHRYLCKYRGNGQMAICQLDDSNSFYFAEDGSAATLDGSHGDVYVACRKLVPNATPAAYMGFYYDVLELGDGKYMLSVSNAQVDENMKYWSESNFIAAFRAEPTTTYNGNTIGAAGGTYYLRSIAQQLPVFTDTFANIDTAMASTRMNSAYFDKIGPEEHAIIAMLFYIKFGTTNSQAIFGMGYNIEWNSVSAQRGMKNTYGDEGFVNIFGLEDWWNTSQGEYMGHIRYSSFKIYVTPWGSTENYETYIATPLIDLETVIRNMRFSAAPLMMLPKGMQSPLLRSWSQNFCDAVHIIGRSECITRGNGNQAGAGGAGIAAMKLGCNTASDEVTATRLRFRTDNGKVTLYNSPADFLNLTAVDPAN